MNAYPELEMINYDTQNVQKKETQKIEAEVESQNQAIQEVENDNTKEDGDEE